MTASADLYRELTDLHAIQALLADTVAQEAALDDRLEALLVERSQFASALAGLDAATQVLDVVHADAQSVATSISGTCALAERVSSKVCHAPGEGERGVGDVHTPGASSARSPALTFLSHRVRATSPLVVTLTPTALAPGYVCLPFFPCRCAS